MVEKEDGSRRPLTSLSFRSREEQHGWWTHIADLILRLLDTLKLRCVSHRTEVLSLVLLKVLLVQHLENTSKHTRPEWSAIREDDVGTSRVVLKKNLI